MVDFVARCAIRVLYWAARAFWWVFRPTTRGAHVAVWHGDRLLLVTPSYRRGMSFPGGFVSKTESLPVAAARELGEEVGIDLPPAALTHVADYEITFESRLNVETVFEVHVDSEPPVTVDRREILSARFLTIAEALRCELTPVARLYLSSKESSIRP